MDLPPSCLLAVCGDQPVRVALLVGSLVHVPRVPPLLPQRAAHGQAHHREARPLLQRALREAAHVREQAGREGGVVVGRRTCGLIDQLQKEGTRGRTMKRISDSESRGILSCCVSGTSAWWRGVGACSRTSTLAPCTCRTSTSTPRDSTTTAWVRVLGMAGTAIGCQLAIAFNEGRTHQSSQPCPMMLPSCVDAHGPSEAEAQPVQASLPRRGTGGLVAGSQGQRQQGEAAPAAPPRGAAGQLGRLRSLPSEIDGGRHVDSDGGSEDWQVMTYGLCRAWAGWGDDGGGGRGRGGGGR